MKLWELTEEIEFLNQALNDIEESDLSDSEKEGLIADLISQQFDNESAFKEKALNVGEYIKYLDALTTARKEEIKRLQLLTKQSENRLISIKKYLTAHLTRIGTKKIEGTKCSISLRKKPAYLELTCDAEDLPEEFQRITIEVDKTKLKDFIKQNGDLTFAKMVDNNEFSLIIK